MARGKPVQEGVRVQAPARARPGTSSPRCTPDEIKKSKPLAGRLLPAAAPAPRSGRHGLPEAADRRDEEADRPRPHALRPRLRPARSPAARVPGADLPDDAAGPRRRLQGTARHARQLPRALQRHPESQAARGPAAAGDAVPAAAVQRHRRPPRASSRTRASPASTATPTATPTPPPTRSATSGPTSTATASTRRRCAA